MKLLDAGDLLEYPSSKRVERVLWVVPGTNDLYTIDVQSAAAFPVYLAGNEVATMLRNGEAHRRTDDPWAARLFGDPSRARQRVRDRWWARISDLVKSQPEIFNAKGRVKRIDEAIAKHGGIRRDFYTALRRYWQGGMTPDALVGRTDRSGGKGKTRKSHGIKRGRPTVDGDPARNIGPDERVLISHYVRKHRREMDLAACRRRMVRDHFSDVQTDDDGKQVFKVWPTAPSYAQFCYWANKDVGFTELRRRQLGSRVFDSSARGLTGSATAGLIGPGSEFIIDATLADVYLVSKLNPELIVGRPVIYLVIDSFSRLIVGMYVGLENASWVGAMMALVNVVTDKVEFCRRFDISIEEEAWPNSGLPKDLLADRGEAFSKASDTLSNRLGVNPRTTTAYRGDLKSILEQRFKMLPATWKAYTPGYIQPDFRERGGRDYRLDAKLTIDDFTHQVILAVLHHNSQPLTKHKGIDPEVLAAVPTIPLDMWDWGLTNRTGRLRRHPEDFVKLALMPTDEAVVTHEGIRFYDMFYTCERAESEGWFVRARDRGVWKIKLSYDPRTVDFAYILRNGSTDYDRCTLALRSQTYSGLTLWEADQVRGEARARKLRGRRQHDSARITYETAVEANVSAAKRRAKQAAGSGGRLRTDNIRANREAEVAALRHDEAIIVGPSPESPSPPVATGETPHGPIVFDDDELSFPTTADLRRLLDKGQP